jgi:hypothetical protein
MNLSTRKYVMKSTPLTYVSRLSIVIAVCGASVLVVQGSAQATGRSSSGHASHVTSLSLPVFTAAICKNVSAASVSAIVGYSVPAPTFSMTKLPATKKNFYISGVSGVCTYGKETSEATILKAVNLEIEVTSKPFTLAEAKEEISAVEAETKTLHFKITSYNGLGLPAYYFSLSDSGYFGQGISAISGTTFFGASVSQKSISIGKVASLAKLAEKL